MKDIVNYKVVSGILAIVVIVLAVMLVNAKSAPAPELLETATDQLAICREGLASWRAANPSRVEGASEEALKELQGILEDCLESIAGSVAAQ